MRFHNLGHHWREDSPHPLLDIFDFDLNSRNQQVKSSLDQVLNQRVATHWCVARFTNHIFITDDEVEDLPRYRTHNVFFQLRNIYMLGVLRVCK